MSFRFSPSTRQRGLSLLEALVALVVVALGILAVIGMQMRTLVDTQTAARRAQAIALIEDFSERLKIHPNALLAVNDKRSYISDTWDIPLAAPAKSCDNSACNGDELAAWDVWYWRSLVRNTLPAGDGVIFSPANEQDSSGNQRQLGMLLRWRANERAIKNDAERQSYQDPIDSTRSRQSDGSFISASGEAALDAGCSAAGFVCHLQFIPISARCALDGRGASVCIGA